MSNPGISSYSSPPPPPPPPKPSSHDTPTRILSPSGGPPLPPPPPSTTQAPISQPFREQTASQPPPLPPSSESWTNTAGPPSDPGPSYIPSILTNKSKPDLAEALRTPDLLAALAIAPSAVPPTHAAAATTPLEAALSTNLALASQLPPLHGQLVDARAHASAHLLQAHSLSQQWRAKQRAMDAALAGFAPQALYQRLAAAVAEQEALCAALEESFLEGGDGARAGERETAEWLRRYRDARRAYYRRREGRERWDEGRVGGWR